jgi:mono/diheme cytochrome c family protein
VKRSLALGLALAALLLPASAGAAGADSSGAPQKPGAAAPARSLPADLGAQLFAHYCASCHGTTGVGDGPVAPALSRPPADLTRIAARRGGEFPDGEIAQWIDGRFDVPAHGTREMPIWGRQLADPIAEDASGEEVARGRIDLLVEYLETIQLPAAAPKP